MRENSLGKYVMEHIERGECKCGRCIDRGTKPDPLAHTADMIFFLAAKRGEPTVEEFERLTREHRGEFTDCDPLDGEEHGYLELGGWIGDQGMALQYMALGSLLGIFDLLTPRSVLGKSLTGIDEKFALEMAGLGYVTVKRRAKEAQKVVA